MSFGGAINWDKHPQFVHKCMNKSPVLQKTKYLYVQGERGVGMDERVPEPQYIANFSLGTSFGSGLDCYRQGLNFDRVVNLLHSPVNTRQYLTPCHERTRCNLTNIIWMGVWKSTSYASEVGIEKDLYGGLSAANPRCIGSHIDPEINLLWRSLMGRELTLMWHLVPVQDPGYRQWPFNGGQELAGPRVMTLLNARANTTLSILSGQCMIGFGWEVNL